MTNDTIFKDFSIGTAFTLECYEFVRQSLETSDLVKSLVMQVRIVHYDVSMIRTILWNSLTSMIDVEEEQDHGMQFDLDLRFIDEEYGQMFLEGQWLDPEVCREAADTFIASIIRGREKQDAKRAAKFKEWVLSEQEKIEPPIAETKASSLAEIDVALETIIEPPADLVPIIPVWQELPGEPPCEKHGCLKQKSPTGRIYCRECGREKSAAANTKRKAKRPAAIVEPEPIADEPTPETDLVLVKETASVPSNKCAFCENGNVKRPDGTWKLCTACDGSGVRGGGKKTA